MDNKHLYVYAIIITSITTFFVAYISSAISIVLPTMAQYFSMNDVLQNWISLIYLLVIAVFSIPCGFFSKRYGLKNSLLIGTIIFLVGSIFSALADSSLIIILSRAIEGLGAAFLYVSGTAIIVKAVPDKIRGLALGINLATFYMGLTAAPFLGGFLSSNYGWQMIFYIQIPFLIVAIFLIFFKINKNWVTAKNEPIDLIGLFFVSLAILILMYGFSILNQIQGIILIIVGLILSVFYVRWSLKQKYPTFNLRLFKNTNFLTSNIASLTSYIGIYVLTYILNYHFQYINGFSSELSGALLIIAPLVMTFAAVLAGRMSDKRNPQVVAIIGLVIVFVSTIMITFMDKLSSLNYIILAMVLYGMGYGLFASPNTKIIMSSVPAKENSTASASVATSKYIGKTLSLALFTVIFSIIIGNVSIGPSNYALVILSSQITCGICTVFVFIALISTIIGYKSSDPIDLNKK